MLGLVNLAFRLDCTPNLGEKALLKREQSLNLSTSLPSRAKRLRARMQVVRYLAFIVVIVGESSLCYMVFDEQNGCSLSIGM